MIYCENGSQGWRALGGIVQPNPPKTPQGWKGSGVWALESPSLSCILEASRAKNEELSGTPNPRYFLKSIAGTNGRRTAIQIGGALQYKLEVYCGVSLSPELRSQRGTALQMWGRTAVQIGGVPPVLFRQVVWVGGS